MISNIDSDIYQQYGTRFRGTQDDINPIILADIGSNFVDIADIADINNIDIKNYWSISIPTLKF